MRGSSSRASAARMTVDGLVGERLRVRRVEGDELVVERLGVLVERGEQRALEREVGHVDLELGAVDRLRRA